MAGWGLAAAVMVVPAMVSINMGGRRQPVSWRFERSTLIVEDASGGEVWRKVFEGTVETRYAVLSRQRGWVGDLDGDGRNETLFVHAPWRKSTQLIAFGADGRELWRFEPGRAVVTKKNTYAPPYAIEQFLVTADKKVLVTSSHLVYHPNQLVMLDGRGKVVSEYWHSGRLNVMEVGDLDGDGREEIYLGGVSQGYKMATIVRLDASAFGGASVEEDPMYQLQGFEPGRGTRRVLFPRSCLNQQLERYGVVYQLLLQGESLEVDITERPSLAPYGASSQWTLDREFGLTRFHYSDSFRSQHSAMGMQGLHRHDLESDAGRMQGVKILEK